MQHDEPILLYNVSGYTQLVMVKMVHYRPLTRIQAQPVQ